MTIRYAWSLITLACLGSLLIALAGCDRPSRPPVVPPPTTEQPPLTTDAKVAAEGYTIVFPEGAPRTWVAKAQRWQGNLEAGTMTGTEVSCQLFEQGKEQMLVRGDRCTASSDGKVSRLALSGQVKVQERQRDIRMTADAFAWESTTDQITAMNVHWQGQGMELRAKRGLFSRDLTTFKLDGRPRASF
jgi:hypothetical protein